MVLMSSMLGQIRRHVPGELQDYVLDGEFSGEFQLLHVVVKLASMDGMHRSNKLRA